MAFNIFERWPWTSFQNLNLDWLMTAVKEAGTKADEAAASVGQFDERITTAETNSNEANTKAAEANTKAAEALNTANAASVTANNASDAANAASATASAASANATQARTDAARALSEVGSAIGSYKIFVNAQNQCSHAGELIDAVDILDALEDGRNVFVERANPDNPYIHTGYQFAYYDIDNSTTPATTTVFFDRLISYAGENAIVERMYLVGSSNTAGFTTIQTLASKSYVDSHSGGSELPAVTTADNGKVLGVVNGAWGVKADEGGGSAPFEILITESGDTYSTTATAAEIIAHADNCVAVFSGLKYTPDMISTASNAAMIMFSVVVQDSQNPVILNIFVTVQNGAVTIAMFTKTIDPLPTVTTTDNGKFLRVVSGAWAAATSDSEPVITVNDDTIQMNINPNTLYIFPNAGQLTVIPANPVAGVVNEYHFLFYSGATATTLTLPSTIRQPDGFTVEANHWYEVSILENNMLAYGWAVSGT